MRRIVAIALAMMVVCAAFGDVPISQTTEDYVFAFDSATIPPYAVTNANEVISLTRLPWQGVTASVDGGAATILVAPGASGAPLLWEPASAGVWTLCNSVEGEVEFTVRHGPYGTQGAGTAVSPLKILDSLELRDLVADGTAADGAVFSLRDGLEPGAIVLPPGWCASMQGGTWSLATSIGGMVSSWDGIDFAVDLKLGGPDRKIHRGEGLPVAYSGDSWCGNASASSTLTVTPPQGAVTVFPLAGSGILEIPLEKTGKWNLALDMGSKTLESEILVSGGFFLIVK